MLYYNPKPLEVVLMVITFLLTIVLGVSYGAEAYRTPSTPIWICFGLTVIAFLIQVHTLWTFYKERNSDRCKLSG